ATCCFVVVNPETRELAICRAGHPPALVLPPRGKPRVLDCDAGLPLGIDTNAEYRTTQLQVEPGSVLVLTTDGLMVADSADAHNLSSLLAGGGARRRRRAEWARRRPVAPPPPADQARRRRCLAAGSRRCGRRPSGQGLTGAAAMSELSGRTFLVTGANAGIGYATAQDLA